MDKAMDTFVFQCPRVYVNDIIYDLRSGGTYEGVDLEFINKFGLGLTPTHRHQPPGYHCLQ